MKTLPNTLTASQGQKVEAQGRGAMVADLDWTLVGAKEEPSPEENAQALSSTSSQWEEVDAEETGAIGIDLDSVPVLANKESPKETDATEVCMKFTFNEING
ncbi:uncharacterized protein LOC124170427 [Ischnura elegans]|uniref:uncharacterized protein LOC124170427 n=1 Tax=Ischnura elegans TaxID=197161 RepID=UPI001ED8795D|nr:uncharacterized protein LOC124170427 [Ischnura elegans]